MDNSHPEKKHFSMDTVKWAAVLSLTVGAIGGNAYFSDLPFLYRLVGVVAVLAVAIFVLSGTEKGDQLFAMAKDARAEVRRVVWPTKQETWATSGVVVVVVLLSALILWGVDYALGSLVSYIIA